MARRSWLGGRQRWGATAWLVVAASGCAALYDLGTEQCDTHRDCEALGSNLECRQHLCQTVVPSGGGNGGAGHGCTNHGECIDDNFGEPWACIDGSCVELKSSECPLVLGEGEGLEFLRRPAPLLLGAYSNFEALTTVAKSSYNYQLAVEEFNNTTRGIPGGTGQSKRPFVLVVCTSGLDDVGPSVEHLVRDLKVPAILGSLPADKLEEAFDIANHDLDGEVFFLSPFDANDSLRTLDDDRLLWHMLDSTSKLAPPYVPLVARAEAFQKNRRPNPSEPIKVLLVESDAPLNTELAERVVQSIEFNGMSATDNELEGHFSRVSIDSSDMGKAVAALQDAPHIIIAMTTSAFFVSMIGNYEKSGWEAVADEGEPRPFYLLSPLLFNDAKVPSLVEQPDMGDLRDRIAGVNFVTLDSKVYDSYLSRLRARFSDATIPLENTENYYDAAYYLMYSFAAAGPSDSYDGPQLIGGIEKLLRRDVETDPCGSGCATVGPTQLSATIDVLRNSEEGIALVGTLGPPDFDLTSGTRNTQTSVWCVDDEGADSYSVKFVPDALLYDQETRSLAGDFSCIDGF